jgi:signal transduction histidine kinase
MTDEDPRELSGPELEALFATNRELVRINERLAAAVEARTMDVMRAREAETRARAAEAGVLSGINREVRGPLNAIIGYSEMLAEDLEALELYDLAHDVEKIKAAGEALLAVLDDIHRLRGAGDE